MPSGRKEQSLLCLGGRLLVRFMPRFNFFALSRMTFWSGNAAAPSLLMTAPFYNRRPGYLRTDMPPLYPDTYTFSDGSLATVKRLFGSDAPRVAAFLEAHYGGDDWRIHRVESWVGAYLRDAETVALGLFAGEALLATIFSVPLGTTLMTHGGLVRNMRNIEGLCVAPRHRGSGIAGFMIRHADAFTSYKFGVCAHLWARELDAAPYFGTALTVDKYGYTETGQEERRSEHVRIMPWSNFAQLWTSNSPAWVSSPVTEPAIVVSTPSNRRGTHRVFYGHGGVCVVSDTERVSAAGKRIYEIVWSGRIIDGGLVPAREDFDFKQLVDGAAAALPAGGVLFGTTVPNGGGLRDCWDGWRVGHSGYHALYIYNYMPPAFGACRIHSVRDEI
jgi:hypothetical protein